MKNCPIEYAFAKVKKNICQILKNSRRIAKYILVFAKVAKLR